MSPPGRPKGEFRSAEHDGTLISGTPVSVETVVTIAPGHPAFAGHFPGAPVLPGVVLLSLVMQALADLPDWAAGLGATPQIDAVKFLAPVAPGQVLRLRLTRHDTGVAFEIGQGARVAARGRLSAAAPP